MSTFNGLPLHVLIVHAVVVLIPLSAVLLILVSVWPAARARFADLTAVLAVVALISVPITTQAGEWLEHRVARTPLVHVHTELGDTMLPWAIGLAVLAVAVAVRHRLAARRAPATEPHGVEIRDGGHRDGAGGRDRVLGGILAALALVVAVGATVTVYRIGDSGARAAWTGQFTQQAQPRPGAVTPGGDEGGR
jgi:hypothetical protein